ncbi:MAG: LptF/LptG family permease [Deltaproteobacteria bacterium]|nr:LptF/LptG family permease [Deltaproteobacteria bacterium]
MRLSLVDRMLLRETLVPLGVGLLAIVQLLVLVQLLQLNEVVFGGAVRLGDLARVTAGLAPHFLAMAVPLAFVLAVQLGLGRLAADRELLALSASGRSPLSLYRVPLAIAAVLCAGAFWLTGVAEPWGLKALSRVLNAVIKRSLEEGLRPGLFNQGLPRFMVYVDKAGAQGSDWRGVLIEDSLSDGPPLLALARAGRLVDVAGETLALELTQGELHRIEPRAEDRNTERGETYARFDSARFLVGVEDPVAHKNRFSDNEAMFSEGELLERARRFEEQGDTVRAGRARLERARRVAAPLATLAFVLLAVPLALLAAGSRAAAYVTCVGAFAAFYTLSRVGQVAAEHGHAPWVMAFLPEIVIGGLGLVLSARLLRGGVGVIR